MPLFQNGMVGASDNKQIAEALNLPPAEIWPSRYSEPVYKDE
ncbi:helix-turn-helix domain-containing protein [Serratia plymuthica]|nr:helix-turn-helix domain-containing protein [Serratia plymuthica]